MVSYAFWVGGTDANIAMAYARMQYLEFFPKTDLVHYFIDTWENLLRKADGGYDNIGIKEWQRLHPKNLDLQLRSLAANTDDQGYDTFGDFRDSCDPSLIRLLFEGIEKTGACNNICEPIFSTKVRSGNFYTPRLPRRWRIHRTIAPRGSR